jgi:hypothetical protein
MIGIRRREIESELAAWRAAERRQDMARPGSAEKRLAAVSAAVHRANFQRLTDQSVASAVTTSK